MREIPGMANPKILSTERDLAGWQPGRLLLVSWSGLGLKRFLYCIFLLPKMPSLGTSLNTQRQYFIPALLNCDLLFSCLIILGKISREPRRYKKAWFLPGDTSRIEVSSHSGSLGPRCILNHHIALVAVPLDISVEGKFTDFDKSHNLVNFDSCLRSR